MGELKSIAENIKLSEAIIAIIAVSYLIRLFYSTYKKMTFFHDELQKREEILASIEILKNEFQHMRKGLETITRESREYRRTSLHDKITKAYIKYKQQNYVTHAQLENFQMCLQKYYEVDGNGLVKNKIEKEILNLEVREE